MAENFGPGILGGIVLIDPETGQPYRATSGGGGGGGEGATDMDGITDATVVGKAVVRAVDAAAARTAVGLGNVDNTADSAKPVSTAQQTALNAKAPLASPTFTGTVAGVTKAHVGLGNADNTSDANKPVSTAQQTALNLKANLASPTFTGTVSGVTKAHVGLSNVDNTADTAKPVSTAQQTALNLKANLAGPTFTGTVSGITKAMVGLSNVDNTSDANKPISTATQTALDAKYDSLADLPVSVPTDLMQASDGTWPSATGISASRRVSWRGYPGRSDPPAATGRPALEPVIDEYVLKV